MALYFWATALSLICWVAAAELARRFLLELEVGAGAAWGTTSFLGGLAIVGSGPLLWGAASGMEVPLMALATIGFLRAIVMDRSMATAAFGLMLAATRPEGALIVAVLAVWQAVCLRRLPWNLTFAAPGAIQPALNLWFTGTLLSGSVAAKANPRWFHTSEYSQLGVLWENYIVGGYGEAFFGGVGIVVLGLFAAGLGRLATDPAVARIRRGDPRVAVLLVWLLPLCLDVFVMRRPTQGARYLMPGLVVFLPMVVIGVRSLQIRWAEWAFAALCVAEVGQWSQRLIADSAEVLRSDVAAARFVAEQLPPGATVAGNDVGALGYFGDHRVLDLEGLVSPRALPYALDGRAGEFHLIATERPDLVVIFPAWFPGFIEDGLLDVLAGVSVDDPKAIGASALVIARPVAGAFASRGQLPALQDEERALDVLDEGDRADEQAHAWSDEAGLDPSGRPARGWFGAGVLERGRRSEVVRATWEGDVADPDAPTGASNVVIDSLRRHEDHEGFALTGTGERARLVGRLGPSSSPQSLRIRWTTDHHGMREGGVRDVVVPIITGWYALEVDLGAVSGTTEFTVDRQTGLGGTTGGWGAAHWWLLG